MKNEVIVVVFTEQEGEERYQIGSVAIDLTLLPKQDDVDPGEDVDGLLADLWSEWRDEVEHPDTDSEFIDWLVANKPGFSRPKVETTYSVISV